MTTSSPPTHATVLIVEDDELYGQYLAAHLTCHGYHVCAITDDARLAIELAERFHPDVMTVDIGLAGDLDGIELAEKVRDTFAIPVLFISSHAAPEIVQRAKRATPYAYLIKPFNERELSLSIELTLHRHRLAKVHDREQEARYEELFRNNPLPMLIVRTDDTIIDVNNAAVSQYGLPTATLTGRPYSDLLVQPVANGTEALVADAPETRFQRHVRADGSFIDIEAICHRIVYASVDCVLVMALDVTQRLAAEKAERLSTVRMAAMMETMADGFVALDSNWRYIFVNRSAGVLLGRDPQGLIGKNIWEEFPDGADQPFAKAYEQVMNERTTAYIEAYYAPWSRWFENRIVPFGDGISVYFQDITERKSSEIELNNMNQQLRALSGRLLRLQEEERRHTARELHDEIGQSLTALKMSLQSIRLTVVPREIETPLDMSITIANDLLNQVRRMSLDLRPPQLDDLGLSAAIKWNLERQARIAGLHAHFSTHNVPARLPELVTIACYRICQEAVNNVVRHAGARNVWIKLFVDNGTIALTVRDDGKGFTVAPSVAIPRVPASMGVLSMKERAKMAGGNLNVDSAPGFGTEVRAEFSRLVETTYPPEDPNAQ